MSRIFFFKIATDRVLPIVKNSGISIDDYTSSLIEYDTIYLANKEE